MNIYDLTLGQLKELRSIIGVGSQSETSNLYKGFIGKYVIIRSRNEGLNAGYLEEADETGCVLRDAKRMWYHRPAVKTESWYEGVANHGLSDDSKISAQVARKAIIEDYSIVECTEKATKSILGAAAHVQS